MDNNIRDLVLFVVFSISYLFSFIKFILIAARRDIKLPIVYLCLGVINGLFFLFYGIYDQYNHGYNLVVLSPRE